MWAFPKQGGFDEKMLHVSAVHANHITVDADGFCLDSEVNIYVAIWVLVKC